MCVCARARPRASRKAYSTSMTKLPEQDPPPPLLFSFLTGLWEIVNYTISVYHVMVLWSGLRYAITDRAVGFVEYCFAD